LDGVVVIVVSRLVILGNIQDCAMLFKSSAAAAQKKISFVFSCLRKYGHSLRQPLGSQTTVIFEQKALKLLPNSSASA
jgi:hypothetical protein